MNLAMDPTGLLLTANYPYPNLQCSVKLKCDANSIISSTIIAVTIDFRNTYP